jgi:hypothetical protein
MNNKMSFIHQLLLNIPFPEPLNNWYRHHTNRLCVGEEGIRLRQKTPLPAQKLAHIFHSGIVGTGPKKKKQVLLYKSFLKK